MAQTNLRTHYFKVIEHGTKLFNAHRFLNSLAFFLGLVGMIIIFATEEVRRGIEQGRGMAWVTKLPI
jgi:hypothetical protein